MNLVVDIGNTNVKAALFDGEALYRVFENVQALLKWLETHRTSNAILSRTGNVAEPEATLQLKAIPYLIVNHKARLPIKIAYASPATLGADRIAGSVAASALFPGYPVLKIDFGTCITYDVITDDSRYLGGAISPGINMRFKALNQFTAALPLCTWNETALPVLTGDDTQSCIVSGVVNGVWSEVEQIINQYTARYPALQVVVTGGDAPRFVPMLKSKIFARPHLVLEGLNRILNYNIS